LKKSFRFAKDIFMSGKRIFWDYKIPRTNTRGANIEALKTL